jgi:predicted ABC-type ATPase
MVPMSNLYIIAGCNGAGKTTASYTVLPEILNCKEFVNADNIAAGISPFNPSGVAIEAGRIMLSRINELMSEGDDFAFETTLSTKSYVSFVKKAQKKGYDVTLLYFWLSSPQMAIKRVAKRVSNGGHDIPEDVIERRYFRGIANLLKLYIPICDNWLVIDNNDLAPEIIAQGSGKLGEDIKNNDIWNDILTQGNDNQG